MTDNSNYIAMAYGFAVMVIVIMIVLIARDFSRQKSALKTLGADWRP